MFSKHHADDVCPGGRVPRASTLIASDPRTEKKEPDIRQQAVDEMMQRIKKGIQLRPVQQGSRSSKQPKVPPTRSSWARGPASSWNDGGQSLFFCEGHHRPQGCRVCGVSEGLDPAHRFSMKVCNDLHSEEPRYHTTLSRFTVLQHIL